MTRRITFRIRVVVATTAVACAPAAGWAQASGGAPPVSGFVSVSAGLTRPASSSFETVATDNDGINRDELQTRYAVRQRPGFDIGGGVLLRDRLIVGLAVSRLSDAQAAVSTIKLTHPQFHPTITASATSSGAERTETGVHIQLGYKIPLPGRYELSVFGGPSHFSATQALVADLNVTETQNRTTGAWSVSLRDVETERQRGSGWGYHVGTDFGVRLSNSVSVATLTRYSRAAVSVEDPILSMIRERTASQDINVGGLQVMAGVRVRF